MMQRTVGILALLLWTVGCASPLPRPSAKVGAHEPTTSPAPSSSEPSEPTPSVSPAEALAGDPTVSELSEVRLVPSSCENHKQATDARLAQMRTEVDREFKRWHDAQPSCWEEDRQREKERRRYEEMLRRGEFGGLGLHSVGAAGAGHGDGIGLGSVGTIGHGAGVGRAKSMSRTNNQIANVDEADIVKTDGQYVYMVANGALRIVEAMNPRVVSVTRLRGFVRELLVEGNRAVVFSKSAEGRERCSYAYDCTVAGDGTATRIDVYDIENRSAPKHVRKIELSGSLMASRRIGTTILTVVADGDNAGNDYETWPSDLHLCGTKEATVRAKFAALKKANEAIIKAHASLPTLTDQGVTTSMCAGLLNHKLDQVHTFTSIVSFDIHDPKSPIRTATIRSRPGTVFVSENALYMATHRRKNRRAGWYSYYSSIDEVSELHKFRVGSKPDDTRYVGSGTIPGHVLNQFAMDEWNGNLRIATTLGKVPNPNVRSAVSILSESSDGNLVRVGAIENLAPGEDLRAIRFDGDRGYLVTFKKTDPLFVVDLRSATSPAVLGELKIPGFSTYLHRIDPTHLLSIGYDADDHGNFAYFDGVLLQLFDVTHPTTPRLVHKEKIGTRGSSSASTTDHLAFNYLADRGLLAIPTTVCEGGGDGRQGQNLTFAGLLVYRVGVERGFERLGGVAHAKAGSSCSGWWSKGTSVVQRSVFLDDLVYSMALDRVKVQRMSAFGVDVADISLQP